MGLIQWQNEELNIFYPNLCIFEIVKKIHQTGKVGHGDRKEGDDQMLKGRGVRWGQEEPHGPSFECSREDRR